MDPGRPPDAGRLRFEGWVRDHHAAAYQSAWRITRHRADADDVVQQTFLRLLESPDAIANHPEPQRAVRWLAVKTALTFRRGETNRRRREEAHAMGHAEIDQRDDAVRRERLAAVRASVAALPDELRIATVLRFQEGLTFAAMAELLEVSEPTMFERVKRALEKLRVALTQAGHGALAIDLEGLLAMEEVTTVPAKLGATLLALAPGGGIAAASAVATTTTVASWLAPASVVAAVVVALVGGGALAVRSLHSTNQNGAAPAVALAPRERTKTDDLSAPVVAERAIERTPAPTLPPVKSNSPTAMRARELLFSDLGLQPEAPWDEAQVETGHLRGVAVDDDGRTLPHVDVVAFSTAGAPKGFQWRAAQSTADDGSFDLRVAVVGEPQPYFVEFADPDVLPRRIDALVAQNATAEVGRVVLRRNRADRAGDWSLRLTLVDRNGAPVQGAGVRVLRKQFARTDGNAPAASPPTSAFEVGGVTDDHGLVQLAGTRVGEKSLQIYARFLGFRDEVVDISIEATGAGERRLVVERGLTLRGRLALPAGCVGARLDAVPMANSRTSVASIGDSFQGDVAADGTFVVAGLDPGRYRLRVSGDFSPAWVDDVAAGRDDVVVELKRADDPHDVGVHRAELHGRVVAAATGAPVPVDREATRVIAVPAEWRPDDPRILTELVPNALAAQVAQVFFDDSRPPPAPSGDFHATGLDAGSYLVLVRAKGFFPGVSRVVTLKEREIAADLIVPLERSE